MKSSTVPQTDRLKLCQRTTGVTVFISCPCIEECDTEHAHRRNETFDKVIHVLIVVHRGGRDADGWNVIIQLLAMFAMNTHVLLILVL